eukprot:11225057-Lingulodinium_polyedra.AAC.1
MPAARNSANGVQLVLSSTARDTPLWQEGVLQDLLGLLFGLSASSWAHGLLLVQPSYPRKCRSCCAPVAELLTTVTALPEHSFPLPAVGI